MTKQTCDTITITVKEYDELLHAWKKLIALEGGGVDNWEGYYDAMEEMDDEEDDEY
jgi:hypothetical protein